MGQVFILGMSDTSVNRIKILAFVMVVVQQGQRDGWQTKNHTYNKINIQMLEVLPAKKIYSKGRVGW